MALQRCAPGCPKGTAPQGQTQHTVAGFWRQLGRVNGTPLPKVKAHQQLPAEEATDQNTMIVLNDQADKRAESTFATHQVPAATQQDYTQAMATAAYAPLE